MLLRMDTSGIGDAGLDPSARLENIVRRARQQNEAHNNSTKPETAPAQSPKFVLGGGGFAAAGAQSINFDDPLARECFIGGLTQTAQAENLMGGHELNPERVAALLDLG